MREGTELPASLSLPAWESGDPFRVSLRAPQPPSPLPQETALSPRLPLMSAPLFMTLCALQKEGSRDQDQSPVG